MKKLAIVLALLSTTAQASPTISIEETYPSLQCKELAGLGVLDYCALEVRVILNKTKKKDVFVSCKVTVKHYHNTIKNTDGMNVFVMLDKASVHEEVYTSFLPAFVNTTNEKYYGTLIRVTARPKFKDIQSNYQGGWLKSEIVKTTCQID